MTQALTRNNVVVSGYGDAALIFAHGYGCDQNIWRLVAPAFADDYRIILFDHVGAGRSDLRAYAPAKYAALDGYAGDVLEICDQLALKEVVYVGHSVSTMIGVLAAIRRPELFKNLILVGPSACYIDDDGYRGGFSHNDIQGLLAQLDSNYLGWARSIAPVIMGNPEHPELSLELTESFCRTEPTIAKAFARVTFLSDNRDDLKHVRTPTLVMQCSQDALAPEFAGRFVHDQVRDSEFVHLRAKGHCPHLSAPKETIAEIQRYLNTDAWRARV